MGGGGGGGGRGCHAITYCYWDSVPDLLHLLVPSWSSLVPAQFSSPLPTKEQVSATAPARMPAAYLDLPVGP